MLHYRNKKWLENKYVDGKLSTCQIAEIEQVGFDTISNWLKKFSIPIRSLPDAVHLRALRKVNHCSLSRESIEWINGELLGDGCIYSNSKYSAQIFYSSKYFEYINYVAGTLKSFGIKQTGKIKRVHNKTFDCYWYYYSSLTYSELLPIRKQWYPEEKKVVPHNITLTPLTIRQWYIGDGCLSHPKDSRPYILLCTYGFSAFDVDWLVRELIKLEFKTTREPNSNTIYISVYSTQDFLDYIGTCPVKCYQYKWNY